jgi:hypothetical protein
MKKQNHRPLFIYGRMVLLLHILIDISNLWHSNNKSWEKFIGKITKEQNHKSNFKVAANWSYFFWILASQVLVKWHFVKYYFVNGGFSS